MKWIHSLCVFTLLPHLLQALPSGHKVAAGSAEFHADGPGSMRVHVSDKAIINYQSFDIAHGERVTFVQPKSSSCVLNRIQGDRPTQIDGTLSANGKLFLINPQGICFGKSSMVSASSLIASTLELLDENFLQERYQFQGARLKSKIVNEGTLSSPEGLIVFLAPQIEQKGSIIAKAGKVALLSGEKITLDFGGDGLIRFAIDEEVQDSYILNSGQVQAEGGCVQMSTRSAADVIHKVLNLDTWKMASEIVLEGGVICLSSESAVQAGQVQLMGSTIDHKGSLVAEGDMTLRATERISLHDQATDPLTLQSKGKLTLESNCLDICAFRSPATRIASLGDLFLISENPISSDAHFTAGGSFSAMKPTGAPADLVSYYDPIISATSHVTFGSYTGVSLMVQCQGQITSTGNITITGFDTATFSPSDSYTNLLTTTPSLIMRSGLASLTNYTATPISGVLAVPPNQVTGGATFTNSSAPLGNGIRLNLSSITLNPIGPSGATGKLILESPSYVVVGSNLSITTNGGSIEVTGNLIGDVLGRTLTIQGTANGNVTFNSPLGDPAPLSTVLITALGGNILFKEPVVLGGTTSIATRSGAITFDKTIDSDGTARALTIVSGAGDIAFKGDIGGRSALASLSANTNGTIEINDVGTTSLEGVTGAIAFGTGVVPSIINFTGSIYKANGQSYLASSAFNLNTPGMKFVTSGDAISFSVAPINLATNVDLDINTAGGAITATQIINTGLGLRNVTLNAGTASITVGQIGSALGQFNQISLGNSLASSGIVVIRGPLFANAITLIPGTSSSIFLGSSLTTNNTPLFFPRPVICDTTSAITLSTNADILFLSSIDADSPANERNLILSAGQGNICFYGNVGGSQRLQSLTASAKTIDIDKAIQVTKGLDFTAETTYLGANVNNSTLDANAPLIIRGSVVRDTMDSVTLSTSQFGGNSITITGNLSSDLASRALTLNAGSGPINLLGSTALSTLTLQGGEMSLANVDVATFDATASGPIHLLGTNYNHTSATYRSPSLRLPFGKVIQMSISQASFSLPPIFGLGTASLSLFAPLGSLTLNTLKGVGRLAAQAAEVLFSGPLSVDTLKIEATGEVRNSAEPTLLTIRTGATFDSKMASVGSKTSPIAIASEGPVFVGAKESAIFIGHTPLNTLYPLVSHRPKYLIFNGMLLSDSASVTLQARPSQFLTIPTMGSSALYFADQATAAAARSTPLFIRAVASTSE